MCVCTRARVLAVRETRVVDEKFLIPPLSFFFFLQRKIECEVKVATAPDSTHNPLILIYAVTPIFILLFFFFFFFQLFWDFILLRQDTERVMIDRSLFSVERFLLALSRLSSFLLSSPSRLHLALPLFPPSPPPWNRIIYTITGMCE